MSLDSRALMNALTTLASESGVFETVFGHEPKAAPSVLGVSCGVWVNDIRGVQSSGLSSVSMRVEFVYRVFRSMLTEPQDDIDPEVIDATDALLTRIIGEFRLGLSDTRYVDVQGSDGEPLRAVPGYIDQDGKKFRVMEIFVPIIVNDVYTYAA